MGDPSGIGSEICAKALTSKETAAGAKGIVIGSIKALRRGLEIAGIDGIEINSIKKISEAKFTSGIIDCIDVGHLDFNKLKIGQVSAAAGKASMEYLEKAVELAKKKEIAAIVTAPINKEAIHKAGYKFQGHTEFLAARTKSKNYGMMFVSDRLWVMLATIHIPLHQVSKKITKKRILKLIHLANDTLIRVRGKKPKIAVAGLNPHAGETGIFGKEEQRIIQPAVEAAKKEGIKVFGPFSPDSIFNLASNGMFDLVIAMYHDQGLIPLKLLAFNDAVNVTVGLPIIRTSVDHGTGFDIAGKGWANPQSLIKAIKVAVHFAKNR